MKKAINRSVLVIVPKQPYYDWGNQLFADFPIHKLEECWSCLLDDDWDITELERWLKANFDMIFVELLNGMTTLPEAWPERRTWQMFNDWFDWHYSSMVWDLLPDKRIKRETF
jgi:hypothetical protein